MLYQKVEKERCLIEKKIEKIEEELRKYPEGEIHSAKNKTYTRLYYYGSEGRQYLGKKDERLKKVMLQKACLSAQLADLKRENKALDAYLHSFGDRRTAEDAFWENPAFVKELQMHHVGLNQQISAWSHEEYEQNHNYPEQLKFPCLSGNVVRSKSEVFIDQALFMHQIPYRYECRLQLGSISIYPDFTIMNPRTGQLMYWEHFGMMDNPSYAQNAFQKLQLYVANKIIPGHQLIMTFETTENPINLNDIEYIIEQKLS